jgi:hypothetical protein
MGLGIAKYAYFTSMKIENINLAPQKKN